MKRAILAVALVVLASGCAGGERLASTRLTVTALSPYVGLATFHLRCQPSSGDVADPSAACAALAHDPKLVTAPTPLVCGGGPTSWFDVTIDGVLAGDRVHRKFSTCWTRQSPTLAGLGIGRSLDGHIRPRRRGAVQPDSSRVFPPGQLRPGDLLTCTILGHKLELGIADRAGSLGSMGFGGKNVTSVTLTGTRHADGSITAGCTRV